MKEDYSTTIDLDIYTVANDIKSRDGENSETLIYVRGDDTKLTLSFAGVDEDLITVLLSAMDSDDFFTEIILTAASAYRELELMDSN